MAAFGGTDEPRSVVAVQRRNIGTMVEGQVQQFEVSLARGDQVGALLGVVLEVDVCAIGDESRVRGTSLAQAASMSSWFAPTRGGSVESGGVADGPAVTGG